MSISPAEQADILTQVAEANLPCAELVVKLVDAYVIQQTKDDLFAQLSESSITLTAELRRQIGELEISNLPLVAVGDEDTGTADDKLSKGFVDAVKNILHSNITTSSALREVTSKQTASSGPRKEDLQMSKQQKPVEDAEIAAMGTEIANTDSPAYLRSMARTLLNALSDSKRELATMTARVEVADGQAAELDVQLSGAKREIGELKAELRREEMHAHNQVRRVREVNAQLLTVTNELEGERKRMVGLRERVCNMRDDVDSIQWRNAVNMFVREIDRVAGEAPAVASDLGPQPWPCPTGDPHLVFVRPSGDVVPHVGASGLGCQANDKPYKAVAGEAPADAA